MHVQLALFAAFLLAATLICVTPGPDMVYVMSFGMARGRAGGVAAAGGIALGMLAHTMLASFGVSAMAAEYPGVLRVLKYIGVAYLCHLGYGLIRDRSGLTVTGERTEWPVRRIMLNAMAVNLTNPKVLLFYVAFLPQFASASAGPVYLQMLFMGCLFVTMGFATDATVGLVSGRLATRFAAGEASVRRLNAVCGYVMFALAAVIVVTA